MEENLEKQEKIKQEIKKQNNNEVAKVFLDLKHQKMFNMHLKNVIPNANQMQKNYVMLHVKQLL